MKIVRVTCLAIFLLSVTSGCGLLYNGARDKQGQSAVKAASEIKPLETIISMEQRFAGLQDLEVEAARTRFKNIRDGEIKRVVFTRTPSAAIAETWLRPLDERLERIAKGVNWREIDRVNREIQTLNNKISAARDDLLGIRLPSCKVLQEKKGLTKEELEKIPLDRKIEVEQTVGQLLSYCGQYAELSKEHADLLAKRSDTTKLADAQRQLKEDEDHQKATQEQVGAVVKKLQEATAEYQKATKNKEKDPDFQKTVQAAGKTLKENLEKLEKAQGTTGIEVLAEEKVKRLDEVISAIAEGDTDTSTWSPSLKESVAIIASVPALADSATKALQDAQTPRLAPLLIVRQHYQEVVDEAKEVDRLLKKRVEISRKLVLAYMQEAKTLDDIKRKVNPQWTDLSLMEVQKKLQPDEKRQLYELLGKYFGNVAKLQAEEQVLQYQRVGSFYDEDFIRSKHAVVMWQNMTDGIASVLAQYHSSGIKAEEVARFIEAAGIVSIGVGVNR